MAPRENWSSKIGVHGLFLQRFQKEIKQRIRVVDCHGSLRVITRKALLF
jgi:hypothetical protein